MSTIVAFTSSQAASARPCEKRSLENFKELMELSANMRSFMPIKAFLFDSSMNGIEFLILRPFPDCSFVARPN